MGLSEDVASSVEKTALVGPAEVDPDVTTMIHRVPRELVGALRDIDGADCPRVAAAWTTRIAERHRASRVPVPSRAYSADNVKSLADVLVRAKAQERDVFVLVQMD